MAQAKHKKTEINSTAYFLIVLFGGYLGIHKFIDGNSKMGMIYLFTMGLFGIGWIVDIIKAASNLGSNNRNMDSFLSKILSAYEDSAPSAVPPEHQVFINNTLEQELLRIDAMSVDGFSFEHYCADLLLKNGYDKATVTQGSGDFGIDILAEKDNVTYAIQCKCYTNTVGNKAVQEAYSGKEYYKCMVAAVLTNSTFTQAAVETAKETRVLLWDRDTLSKMILNVISQNNTATIS